MLISANYTLWVLTCPMVITMNMPTLGYHILHVHITIANKKVSRITAWWVVAAM